MTANAMKTSVKKCIRVASNLIVRTQSGSICQMLGNFSGVEFLRTVSKFRKKGVILLCLCPPQNVKLGSFTL